MAYISARFWEALGNVFDLQKSIAFRMFFFQSLFGLLAPFGPPLDSQWAKCRENGTSKGAPVDAGAAGNFHFSSLWAPRGQCKPS